MKYINVTIQYLKNVYLDALQAINSKINAYAPNSWWSIQAGAVATVFMNLYTNLQIIISSIYPQNASGDQVDQSLFSQGLPARIGQTYGTIICNVTSTTPVTIPIYTIFSDSGTGNSYQTLQSLVVADGSQYISLYSLVAGANILEQIGNILTSGDISIMVINSTNGQNEESDQSCIDRILSSKRSPQGNINVLGYENYILEANQYLVSPVITSALVYTNFITRGQISILGCFPLIGSPMTDYQLDQGLLPTTTFIPYTRESGTEVINAVNTSIQAQRLVGLSVVTSSCNTFIAIGGSQPDFILQVSLDIGYSLSTVVNISSTDINQNIITISLTVEQLIQREVRYAICTQPFGGVNIAGQNYITIDSIYNVLNNKLGANSGSIAQILTNVVISNTDISVPNLQNNPVYILYTYDIASYNNIVITAV